MEIKINSLDTIRAAAREFIEQMGLVPAQAEKARREGGWVFAFYGKMGAGKTTFVKALCEELGVDDVVNSPTFAIVNEYHSIVLDGPIFHFDFYRIKRLEEAYDIGVDDYFYSGSPCFIEWPELVEDILPEDVVRITIEEQPDGTRTVKA